MIVLKEKYLIALDLDGTLLTDDKKIAPESKEMIRLLMEQGHIVVIATGRTKRLSMLYYQELGLQTPIINSNGAVMHHPLDKSWGNYHLPLNLDTAMEIVDSCYHYQSKNILAAVQDDVYLDQYDQKIADFYGYKEENDGFIVGNVKERLKANPTVMLLYPEEKYISQLTSQLDQLQTEVVDHRNWGAPFHVIEVMNKQMNKEEALKKLADEFDIPRKRIIAFGDGSNDLEMLDYAGIGVAMNNAVDELKTVAKFHTGTNEDFGVAQFLAEYFNVKHPISS